MDSPRVALSLTTEVTRETVEIDGQPHELAVPGDLPLQAHHDFKVWWLRIVMLEAIEEVTKAQTAEYELLNLHLAQLVLPSAAEALRSLDTAQHQAIVMAFFGGAIRTNPTKWMHLLTLAQVNLLPRSGRSSQGSSGSTDERTPSSG